jgi:uncharacterized protein (TIGR02391 family)
MIPDADVLLALEPEELAGFLLGYLYSLPQNERWLGVNRFNLLHEPSRLFGDYPANRREQIRDAVIEAWMCLERDGLLIRKVDGNNDSYTFSRRAATIKSRSELAEQRGRRVLPREQLHERIRQDVWHLFVRGKFDTAVFEAFKEVEVAVRDAAGLENSDIGVTLMRKAFEKTKGPLRDESAPDGERDAVMNLFAGAIGVFKNPQSHRHVALTDANEAAEMILFANYLLRMVDAAQEQNPGTKT